MALQWSQPHVWWGRQWELRELEGMFDKGLPHGRVKAWYVTGTAGG